MLMSVCRSNKELILCVSLWFSVLPLSFELKLGVRFLPFLAFDTSLFICRTWAQARTCGKEGQIFVFKRTAGNFDAKFLRGEKRHGPDPAHLRVLW